MNEPVDRDTWRQWHSRKVRGELLAEQEEQLYQQELARHDREAPPLKTDRAALKKMRERFLALSTEKHELRKRLTELEKEIHFLEQSLSLETRQALGITE